MKPAILITFRMLLFVAAIAVSYWKPFGSWIPNPPQIDSFVVVALLAAFFILDRLGEPTKY